MTKPTRRGLFGLGIGALFAPLAKHLPKPEPKPEVAVPQLGDPHPEIRFVNCTCMMATGSEVFVRYTMS